MLAYLDHAASSPLRPEAMEAMLPWLTERFGNPSGSHSVARAARAAVDDARDAIGEMLATPPGGIVFTGGGTESDNLAVLGGRDRAGRRVVVISPVEHDAVRHAAVLGGAEVRTLPVDADGVVDLDGLDRVVDRDVSLVSVMLVNNETGVIQPVGDVVRAVRRRAPRALVHTDAVAAAPWLDLRTAAGDVDLMTVSAHKFGGPQGVGVLAVRNDAEVKAILGGGRQERERRPGTHNVAGIVGMAAAAIVNDEERSAHGVRLGQLRDRLVEGLLAAVPEASETARRDRKVAGVAHLCFDGVESEALLVLLDDAGVCASAGSACASGAMEPSHVLLAMGLDRTRALGSLRLSLGATTGGADIDLAIKVVPDAVASLRSVAETTWPAPRGGLFRSPRGT